MCRKAENNQDLGVKPSVINIRKETLYNTNFRTVIWTGKQLQVTVMSVPVGGEIGLELHSNLEQFIKIESGCAAVYMGESKETVKFYGRVNQNCAILIPADTWHNILNVGTTPLKVYSVYAPPKHPFGTIHLTKLDADLTET